MARAAAAPHTSRQAVVILHGIGEQRPMETLRNFVLGILGREFQPKGKRAFYSKPDPNAENFELRRYRAFDQKSDTDYIEFYWQHQMPVAGWAFILSWLWLLMTRPSSAMPKRFRFLWFIAWALAALFAADVVWEILRWFGLSLPKLGTLPKTGGALAILFGFLGFVVRAFVGDAAIYLNPHPRTVAARNAIRSSGVELLERLQSDGRYDRLIIVGHSLGSVIAYDILSFAWHRASEAFRKKVEAGDIAGSSLSQPQLKVAEKLAVAGNDLLSSWPPATRKVAEEMRALGLPWMVSDFITLGSPLAHASLLLAKGPEDLQRRKEERELPTSPPYEDDGKHFSYSRTGTTASGAKIRLQVPDHAALFALTRWTNLYFPCKYLFRGDLVGGPVAQNFGEGAIDLPVKTKVWSGWLSHTFYWTRYPEFELDPDSAPNRLIQALDLLRTSFLQPVAAGAPPAAAPSAEAAPMNPPPAS
jgi:hypothetical protein